MMIITLKLIGVILGAYLDRMRGDPKDIISRTFEKVAYGLVAGALLLYDGSNTPEMAAELLSFAVLFALGVSPSWGAVIGAALYKTKMQGGAWWQAGTLKYSIFPALIARGVIWAAPCALVGFYNAQALWCIPAIVSAFALSPYITLKLNDHKEFHDIWAANEWVRGTLLCGQMVIYASI